MPKSVASTFPVLLRCSDYVAGDLDNTYFAILLRMWRNDQIDFGLAEIEAALGTLLLRFTMDDLGEQIRDLFSSDISLSHAKWQKASTELYAFAYFQSRELLHSLGWPPGYGQNTPFDFRASVSDQIIPCDAKPASGNALALVQGEVEAIVARWRLKRGLTTVKASLDYRGTMTQQAVGPALRDGTALEHFAAELDGYENAPVTPLNLNLNGSRIEVTLTELVSLRPSGGIQGVDSLIASLAPTVDKHVKQKPNLHPKIVRKLSC